MQKQPVRYTPELFKAIMLRIASGETVTKICREETMPDGQSVFNWIDRDEEHTREYARAKTSRAEARVDRIDDYGVMLLKGEIDSNTARVLIDKERWQAGKENPKVYSDKQQIEITGKDGEPLSLRLIEAQQRLLKDVTPQHYIEQTFENIPIISPEDII